MRIKHSVIYFLLNEYTSPIVQKLKNTMIFLLIYSSLVVFVNWNWENHVSKLQLPNLTQVNLMFSFVLSILVAFRVNSCYQKWWEARGHWGSLMNNSRNFAIKIKHNKIISKNDKLRLIELLSAIPVTLKNRLRENYFPILELKEQLKITTKVQNSLVIDILDEMYQILFKYELDTKYYLPLDKHLSNIVDLIGACEKIVSTPTPNMVKVFVNNAIYTYIIILPLGLVENLGFIVVPIEAILVFVLLGLEIVAEDLDNPFDKNECISTDSNLNLEIICDNIVNQINNISENEKVI